MALYTYIEQFTNIQNILFNSVNIAGRYGGFGDGNKNDTRYSMFINLRKPIEFNIKQSNIDLIRSFSLESYDVEIIIHCEDTDLRTLLNCVYLSTDLVGLELFDINGNRFNFVKGNLFNIDMLFDFSYKYIITSTTREIIITLHTKLYNNEYRWVVGNNYRIKTDADVPYPVLRMPSYSYYDRTKHISPGLKNITITQQHYLDTFIIKPIFSNEEFIIESYSDDKVDYKGRKINSFYHCSLSYEQKESNKIQLYQTSNVDIGYTAFELQFNDRQNFIKDYSLSSTPTNITYRYYGKTLYPNLEIIKNENSDNVIKHTYEWYHDLTNPQELLYEHNISGSGTDENIISVFGLYSIAAIPSVPYNPATDNDSVLSPYVTFYNT